MDCVIAGGGIIGCSIAWRLAQSGLQVTLIEAEQPGAGASGAAAGMLAPGGEFPPESPLAAHAVASLHMYPNFVAELSAETGTGIDLRQCGAIELPCADPAPLLARAESQRGLGIRTVPQPDGSVLYPDDAVVDPRHVMHALEAACLRRGVRIIGGTAVRTVQPDSGGVSIDGAIIARTAVIAAGAWSSGIRVPGFVLPETFPARGHLLGYRLEPGVFARIIRRGQIYVFQRSNGYTIAGSDVEHAGFDPGPDLSRVKHIRAEAAALVPVLCDLEPSDVWTGFRPATSSGEPVVLRLEGTSIWLAYGHFRNGILLAPHSAERIAAEITASLGRD